MANYLDELNDEQRAAVEYIDGPCLIIARAGTGKTRTLTCKIAYLIDHGYEPWSILALTFTNKAAREMRGRIASLVGQEVAKQLWMGTFHSIFLRILRIESHIIGYTSDFTIYDTDDSKNLLKSIIKDLRLNEKIYKPGLVLNRISNAKNHLLTAEKYASNTEAKTADRDAQIPLVYQIYSCYQERCRLANIMDFDDLLSNTYWLFENHPDICKKYAAHFRYLLVDEYQDTNDIQNHIIQQLSKIHNQVCAVGDDAQSIYSFRGANIDNILNFGNGSEEIRRFLVLNYRSTQTIVKAAYTLIDKNSKRIHFPDETGREVSKGEKGNLIRVSEAYSDVEEGEIVTNQITQLHVRDKHEYSDIAILYRTNAQSRIFEDALRKRGVPYRIYGGLSFYQRKEIKDVISYFRLAVNPNDEEALKRVINYPARGIGDTTLSKLTGAAVANSVSLWEVLSRPLAYGMNINKGTLIKLQGFYNMMAGFREDVYTKDAYELGKDIVHVTGIGNELYQDTSPEGMSRRENIEELITGLHDFCVMRQEEGDEHTLLSDFLSEVSLLTDQDNQKDEDVPKVTLMTIHSAKGLEYRDVFVVGMEEGLLPSAMSFESPRQVEEERRLCYVAITRAKELCFLSYAKSRFKYGKMEFSNASRFLNDIDPQYLDWPQKSSVPHRSIDDGVRRFRSDMESDTPRWKAETPRFVKPMTDRNWKRIQLTPDESPANTGAPSNEQGISVGRTVVHERFGKGEVINVEGRGENCKATIRFENAGTRQLLLKFARFKEIK